MIPEKRPTRAEELFLNLAYNHFYDLFDEIMDDHFWENNAWFRFSKVSHGFAVYAELLTYEPFSHVLAAMKPQRPPMESEIAGELFVFVRNVLAHFPLFETWNEVWINSDLINWQKKGLSIDRFLKKFNGHSGVKYRFWEPIKKRMTYISISFPPEYGVARIYLKDIISEKDGVRFSFVMMRKLLDTQIKSIDDKSQ